MTHRKPRPIVGRIDIERIREDIEQGIRFYINPCRHDENLVPRLSRDLERLMAWSETQLATGTPGSAGYAVQEKALARARRVTEQKVPEGVRALQDYVFGLYMAVSGLLCAYEGMHRP
ncbi:hypothetical protein [Streptomyces luteireticuli]|uniref:Uncharacterized protein n=1 Tax=Streptomyces luteireticuli TaxID=173858 RepID=A0ABN0YZF4_9ACTN